MGFLSTFFNLGITAVKIKETAPEHVMFFLAVQDGLKERHFLCGLDPSTSIEHPEQILKALRKLSSSDFLRVPNDIRDGISATQRTLREPQIMCELGELFYREFGPSEYASFGWPKNW